MVIITQKMLERGSLSLPTNIYIALCVGSAAIISGTVNAGCSLIVVGIYSVFLFLSLSKDQGIAIIILIAFFLRMCLLIYGSYIALLPVEGGDSVNFERTAWQTAQAWGLGEESAASGGGRYYIYLMASLYSVFGRVELIPRFASVIMSLVVIFAIYQISLQVTAKKQAAYLAATFAVIYPTFLGYSAALLREQYIVGFMAMSFYYFLRWIKTGGFIQISLAVMMLFMASLFHGATIFVLVVYLFFVLAYEPGQKQLFIVNKHMKELSGIILLMVGSFWVLIKYFRTKIPFDTLNVSIDSLYRNVILRRLFGRTVYLVDLKPDNIFDLFWQTPIRIFYFSLTPFIWNAEIFMDYILFVEAIIFGLLICMFIYSYKFLRKDQKVYYLAALLVALLLLSMYAWGTTTFGTAVRHRQKIVWLFLPYAAMGIVSTTWWANLVACGDRCHEKLCTLCKIA
jgi:hypothetical protein